MRFGTNGLECIYLSITEMIRMTNSVMNKLNDESAALANSIFSRVHATLQPTLSFRPSVGRLVGRSVGPSHFYFFYQFFPLSHFKSF